jgi:hypothetical protein
LGLGGYRYRIKEVRVRNRLTKVRLFMSLGMGGIWVLPLLALPNCHGNYQLS